jgi:acetyl-CoA carboxylase carboxyltransferase component
MKLPVSARINLLIDDRSFEAFDSDVAAIFITGRAKIAGRPVLIYATDHEPRGPVDVFRSFQKANHIVETALRERVPLIMLLDAPVHAATGKTPLPPDSSRLLADKRGVGRLYSDLARLSGEVPRVCALFGRMGAITVFPVALCDAAVMMEESGVCIGRPDAVQQMIGETVDFDTLGGARMHCTVSGLGDSIFGAEPDILAWIRGYLALMPQHRGERPPVVPALPPARSEEQDSSIVPDNPDKPFDMHPLIERIVDGGSLVELKALYAREVITGLARVEGGVTGILANNSRVRGGILFPETCDKMSRFISICDAFNIPLVFLADTPGFMIGTAAEQAGIIKSSSMLFSAIANAAVPKLTVAVRRAHTAGLYAMAGPGFDPAEFLALPTAIVSVFGKKALDRFAADRTLTDPMRMAIEDMLKACTNPGSLAAKGLIDAVIQISELRPRIAAFLKRTRSISLPKVRRPVMVL